MTFKKLLKTESSSRWTPNLLACRKTIIEKIFIFGIFSVTQLRTQLSSIFLPPQSAPSVSPSVLPSARPSVPSVRLYNPPHLVKYKTISVYRCLCLLREKKETFLLFFFSVYNLVIFKLLVNKFDNRFPLQLASLHVGYISFKRKKKFFFSRYLKGIERNTFFFAGCQQCYKQIQRLGNCQNFDGFLKQSKKRKKRVRAKSCLTITDYQQLSTCKIHLEKKQQ